MFLLLQLVSRGSEDGAAPFPGKKRGEGGRSLGVGRAGASGLASSPGGGAVGFVGPHRGIGALPV